MFIVRAKNSSFSRIFGHVQGRVPTPPNSNRLSRAGERLIARTSVKRRNISVTAMGYEDIPTPEDIKPLFQPFKLGSQQLQTRIVYAPLTRCRAIDTIPAKISVQYYSGLYSICQPLRRWLSFW
jgi:hypothetical protein